MDVTIKEIPTYNQIVDQIEDFITDGQEVDCPVRHYFTPGLYCREISIPAGTVLTSKIHLTCHPYVVSQGSISVIKEDDMADFETIEAPFFGITQPNTRRVLYAHEDVIWTTFHPTAIQPENDSQEAIQAAVDKIEAQIIKPYINELIQHKSQEILK